jgi:hypothetical protein
MTTSRCRFRRASLLGAAFATLILTAAIALADERPDALMDYGGDYTDAGVVPSAPMETKYRVGRGYLADDEEEVAASGAASDGAAGGGTATPDGQP